MSGSGTEGKISLKILVDVKSKKVVFAEAGKDFVDFIFQIMSLPLSTVTELLNEKGMVGCLGALYKSIESLDTQCYESYLNKDSVLQPKLPVYLPLLLLYNVCKTIKLYRCDNHDSFTRYASVCLGSYCPYCSKQMMSDFSYDLVPPRTAGFLKGGISYIVMDNLEVKPMSISVIRSLVKDFDSLEEKQVELGLAEGLALLKASLENQAVLTTVFLGKKK